MTLGGAVGPDPQRVPPPGAVLHVALEGLHGFEHVGQNGFQIRNVHVQLDVGQRPSDIGRDQIEHRLGHRREAADPQVWPEHDDRHLHAGEQVDHVVVAPPQLGVTVVQLFVDGRQLFVARLHLLLRRLDLLVDALELFVRRLDFLVGRLELFVRGVLLPTTMVEVSYMGSLTRGADNATVHARGRAPGIRPHRRPRR